MTKVIDVWDAATFDEELIAAVEAKSDLIRGYFETENQIILNHDLARGPKRTVLRPSNSFGYDFGRFENKIAEQMALRTIRAWHYTRLIDEEVAVLRRDGIHLSTPGKLRDRLDHLVTLGLIEKDKTDALFAASPFHSEQLKSRSGKFWMVSHPISVNDGGVTPLMAHWGGEVASFWTEDPDLLYPLAAIGLARVIEIAVPVRATQHVSSAGAAVVATFGRTLGCIPSKHAFDLYVTEALPAAAVRAVHTSGETTFDRVGREYPQGYIDVDVGRWKELTGEDD